MFTHSFISNNLHTILFLTIQFIISHLFPFSLNLKQFYLTDRIQSGAITSGHSRTGSNSNERVLHIPPNSCITGASPSDYLMSYAGHSLRGGPSYLSAEMKSPPIDWTVSIKEVLGEGDPKAPFSIATTPRCRGGR